MEAPVAFSLQSGGNRDASLFPEQRMALRPLKELQTKTKGKKSNKITKLSNFNRFTASFDLLLPFFFSPLQMFTFPAAVLSGTGTCPFCPLSLLVGKQKQRQLLTPQCQALWAEAFTFLPSSFYSHIKPIPTSTRCWSVPCHGQRLPHSLSLLGWVSAGAGGT